MLLFSVLVAGKAAAPTARATEKLLLKAIEQTQTESRLPFTILQPFTIPQLAVLLKDCGIGCFNRKAISVHALVHSKLDLRTCTVQDLENIHGIGPKTARMFIMHSRPNQQLAALDTHILAHLRELGYAVPASTPSGRRYLELEQICLQLAANAQQTPADWDLTIWRHRSGATTLR